MGHPWGPSPAQDQPHFGPAGSNGRDRSCQGPQPHSRDGAAALLADVQLLDAGHGLAGAGREPAGEGGCGAGCWETKPSGPCHPPGWTPPNLPHPTPTPPHLHPHPPEPPAAGGRCWIAAGPPAAPGSPAASCRPPNPPPSAAWPAPSPGWGTAPRGEMEGVGVGGFPGSQHPDAWVRRAAPSALGSCPSLPGPPTSFPTS